MKRLLIVAGLVMLVAQIAVRRADASEGFEGLVKVVKSGADEKALAAYIDISPVAFALSEDERIYLSDLGVSPEMIKAVVEHGKKLVGETSAGSSLAVEGVLAQQEPPINQAEAVTAVVETPAPADEPKSSVVSIRITGGELAGQRLDPNGVRIVVTPGVQIEGRISLSVRNDMGGNAIAPLAATPTWGEPERGVWEIEQWVKTGTTAHDAAINLTAPQIPGTYYIVFALAGTYNVAQIMSGTHPGWTADWSKGNKVANQPPRVFHRAMAQGWIPFSWYSPEGPKNGTMAMTAVEVIVKGAQTSTEERASEPVPQPNDLTTSTPPPPAEEAPPAVSIPPAEDTVQETVMDAPVVAAPPSESVDISSFYGALSPYGSWVNVDGTQYWQPTAMVVDSSWSPYCQRGNWVYTDCGWMWQSDYSWGWAPFHYGRWSRHYRYGWIWLPDTEWGPAWVSWRHSDAAIGWAPLPPGARYEAGIGFSFHGNRVSADFAFGLESRHFTFVPVAHFSERALVRSRLPRTEVTRVYNTTTIIQNNYTYNNNRIINRGPSITRIHELTHQEIKQVKIVDQNIHPGQPIRRGMISGESVAVYRPRVASTIHETPRAVVARREASAQARHEEARNVSILDDRRSGAMVQAEQARGNASLLIARPDTTPRIVSRPSVPPVANPRQINDLVTLQRQAEEAAVRQREHQQQQAAELTSRQAQERKARVLSQQQEEQRKRGEELARQQEEQRRQAADLAHQQAAKRNIEGIARRREEQRLQAEELSRQQAEQQRHAAELAREQKIQQERAQEQARQREAQQRAAEQARQQEIQRQRAEEQSRQREAQQRAWQAQRQAEETAARHQQQEMERQQQQAAQQRTAQAAERQREQQQQQWAAQQAAQQRAQQSAFQSNGSSSMTTQSSNRGSASRGGATNPWHR